MPMDNAYKIRTRHRDLFLRVMKGHFVTNHSHISYYIDVTMQKSRLSEATAVANAIVPYYDKSTIIDTILCLDGMQVIGTCIAEKLTREDFANMNAHQTIYIVTPEHTSGSQILFRDGVANMITGKNVLILAASVATGYTAKSAVEAIKYYGGNVAGIASIFATSDNFAGFPVVSVFNPNDLQGYASYPPHECPMCQKGERIDALVNSYGFSKLLPNG